jgi:PPOX class probable F420-dependent enzyme
MAAIPDAAKHFFENKDFAHVATINPDGSPQVSSVWIGLDGDLVYFNTEASRVKARNLRNNPSVAISILGQENPYENIVIQGKVAEITGEGAEEDLDVFAKRYLGEDKYPWAAPGEERVIVKIEPVKVSHYAP